MRNERRIELASVIAVCFVCTLTLMYLSPIVSAGLSEGDTALAGIRGFAKYEHFSFIEALRAVQRELSSERGGWFPASAVQPAFWLAFPSPVFAKACQLTLVMANIGTFALLCAFLSRSAAFATCAGIGTLLSLQLRKPHDAILGDTLGLPLTLELVLSALCCYAYFKRSKRRFWLIAALVIQMSACLMHESALVLTLAFLTVDLAESKKISYAWLMFAAPGIELAISVWQRVPVPTSIRWIGQWAVQGLGNAGGQLLAVLPTSYRAFGNVIRDGVYGYDSDTRFYLIPPIDTIGSITCFVASIAMYWISSVNRTPLDRGKAAALSLLAGVLLVTASIFHTPLNWPLALPLGEAYQSVYIGNFGFGCAFALAVRFMASPRLSTSVRTVAPSLLALVTLIIFYGNARADARIIAVNRDEFETVNLINEASSDGLFKWLPEDARVGFDGRPPLPTDAASSFRNFKYLLYAVSGVRHRVVSNVEALRSSAAPVWIMRRESQGPLRGGLTIARMAESSAHGVMVDRALAFRRYPLVAQRDEVSDAIINASSGLRFTKLGSPGSDLVGRVVRTCGAVPLSEVYEPDTPRLQYGAGFFAPNLYKHWNFLVTYYLMGGTDNDQGWRYAGQHAVLTVENGSCPSSALHLRLGAYAAAPGTLTIRAPGFKQVASIGAAGLLFDLKLPMSTAKHFDISFDTSAPAAKEELGLPHYLGDERGPARLVIVNPVITAASGVPGV